MNVAGQSGLEVAALSEGEGVSASDTCAKISASEPRTNNRISIMEQAGVSAATPRISPEINNKLVMLQSSQQNNPPRTKDTSAFCSSLKPAELIVATSEAHTFPLSSPSLHFLELLDPRLGRRVLL